MVHTSLTKLIVDSVDETLKINNLGKYQNCHLLFGSWFLVLFGSFQFNFWFLLVSFGFFSSFSAFILVLQVLSGLQRYGNQSLVIPVTILYLVNKGPGT